MGASGAWEKGGSYLLTHPAVAQVDAGVFAPNLIGERKWLMRSGSPLGDVGLPSCRSRWSHLPRQPPLISLPYVLPWPLTQQSSLSVCLTSVILNLLLNKRKKRVNTPFNFIFKWLNNRRADKRLYIHICDLNVPFVSDPDCEVGTQTTNFDQMSFLCSSRSGTCTSVCLFWDNLNLV